MQQTLCVKETKMCNVFHKHNVIHLLAHTKTHVYSNCQKQLNPNVCRTFHFANARRKKRHTPDTSCIHAFIRNLRPLNIQSHLFSVDSSSHFWKAPVRSQIKSISNAINLGRWIIDFLYLLQRCFSALPESFGQLRHTLPKVKAHKLVLEPTGISLLAWWPRHGCRGYIWKYIY